MFLGKNTTLAYILAAADFSNVYVWNFAKNYCVKLDENQAEILTEKYKEINREIRNFSSEVAALKVKDLIAENSSDVPEIAFSDLIIQRLEPMKAPFPPIGERNINDVLLDLRKKFPQHIFNCPIGLHDKELEKFSDIATPTAEFELSDETYVQAVESMGDAYDKIYKNGRKKVVIKPKDLAQSLGVFALDLAEKNDVKKLCIEHGEELYRGKILAQPFLEGVRQGDIRATIIKNEKGDFECAGYTFRKSARASDSQDFTTGYIVGGSVPRPISDLSKSEQEDLLEKCKEVLRVLNGDLREKYRDSIELGADFILVGNDREVLLGEINHHCPGLTPVSEAMNQENEYGGGLGIVGRVLRKNLKN